MIANLLSFNVLLYCLGAWAQSDYKWLFPVSQWDLPAVVLFLIAANLIAVFVSAVVDLLVPRACAFLFSVFSVLLLMGV